MIIYDQKTLKRRVGSSEGTRENRPVGDRRCERFCRMRKKTISEWL